MKYIWISLFLLFISVVFPVPAFAACSSSPAGDLPGWGPTVTLSSCYKTIASVTGVDWTTNETSTVNSSALTLVNSSLTINNGGSLAVGTLTIAPGSSISVAAGANIKIGTPLYIEDADADGFAITTINLAELSTSTRSGTRRLALMRAWTADCGDSTMSQTNSCTLANGAACASDGVCTSGVCGTNADGDGYFSAAAGHTGTCQASALAYTDCNDSNSNLHTAQTCYYDTDGDTYTNGTTSICAGVNCTNVSGYRNTSAGADCDDNNSSVYPNSCNGNTAYNAACATTSCSPAATGTCETGGGCSAGSCVPVSYTANGTEGPGCTGITNYRCNGAGSCTAPTTTGCYSRVSWSRCSDECTSTIGAISCLNSYTDSGCTAGSGLCTAVSKPYCKCSIYQYDWNPPGG